MWIILIEYMHMIKLSYQRVTVNSSYVMRLKTYM
jgi:hypothetical protein